MRSVQSSTSNNRTCPKEKYRFARQLALMCALDARPFEVSKREGFQSFCTNNAINVLSLPNPTTIATIGLNDTYNMYVTEIKKIFEKAPMHICLVVDCWTDNYKRRPYINMKVHICDNFNLKVFSLNTVLFQHPHTAIRIKQNISATLSEFNLKNKQIFMVSDSGSNIVVAARLAQIHRLPCLAHKIHLLIKKDILCNDEFTAIFDLLKKFKEIYRTLIYKEDDLKEIRF